MQEDLLAKFEELYEELHGRMTSPHPHLEQIYDQLIGRTSLTNYNLIVCFLYCSIPHGKALERTN
jgi:hypothetical protein